MKDEDYKIVWCSADNDVLMTLAKCLPLKDGCYHFNFSKYRPRKKRSKVNWRYDHVNLNTDSLKKLKQICEDILNKKDLNGKSEYELLYENYIRCECAGFCNVVFFRFYEDQDIVISRYSLHCDKAPKDLILGLKDIESLLKAVDTELRNC